MGGDVTLLSLKKRIQAQAQGNPLFLEELVQSLAEARSLDGQPGKYRVSRPAGRIEIPQTIHSVLAARIDLLDGSPKALLQTSAVIGPDISVALLSGMIGVPSDELADDLRTLEAADFLRKVRDAAPEYSFKHELTREVAYGTMLLGLRRSLHAKAVETIESFLRIDSTNTSIGLPSMRFWPNSGRRLFPTSCVAAGGRCDEAPTRTPSEYSNAGSRRFHIGPPRRPKQKPRSISGSPW